MTTEERKFVLDAISLLSDCEKSVAGEERKILLDEIRKLNGLPPRDSAIPQKALEAAAKFREFAKPLAEIDNERTQILNRLGDLDSRRSEILENRNKTYSALLAALVE